MTEITLSGIATVRIYATGSLAGAMPLSGHANISTLANADVYADDLDGFSQSFAAMDKQIINALGDNIIFYAPNGGQIATKCVLTARPGTGNKPGFETNENIWAKIDIYSTIIDLLENTVPGISKAWTAWYKGATYAISEVLYKGDNTITVILYHPGNQKTALGGWK